MTWVEAYLAQADADFARYREMAEGAGGESVHDQLHYFQMACEKLAKAALLASGHSVPSVGSTHKVVVRFVQSLKHCHAARHDYGVGAAQWGMMLDELAKYADAIERLAPALAGNGPNPEYPWPDGRGGAVPPCRYRWTVDPRADRRGQKLMELVRRILAGFGRYYA